MEAYAATVPPVVVPPPSPEFHVKQLIEQYGSDLATSTREQILGTIRAESGFNPAAHNKSDPEGGAIGCAQYLTSTFNHYAPLAGIKDLNIWDCEQQIQTMTYMFKIGEAKQWTCWRRLFRGGWVTCHKQF